MNIAVGFLIKLPLRLPTHTIPSQGERWDRKWTGNGQEWGVKGRVADLCPVHRVPVSYQVPLGDLKTAQNFRQPYFWWISINVRRN